ncbi:hypothetical protein V6N11_021147 [Hibiscus sabdariffa]|uniref:Uncharacterized protein n=1 Tax=Hibiscus sabdariffa TaxID=183260 RepID=A0ABR2AIE6_9ROSI
MRAAVAEVVEQAMCGVAVVHCSTVSREPSLISDGHVAPKQDDVSAEKLPNSQDIPSCASIPITTLVDSTGFPSLQDSIKKTDRGRLDTRNGIVGSTNKFVVLSDGDVTVPEGRKPRAASQGY